METKFKVTHIEGAEYIILPSSFKLTNWKNFDMSTLRACTDQMDKEDYKIYDGDILEKSTGYRYEAKKEWYSMGGFKTYGYADMREDKIIGNIHQDINLLKND